MRLQLQFFSVRSWCVQVCKATRVVVMNCAEIAIQSAKCTQGDLSKFRPFTCSNLDV